MPRRPGVSAETEIGDRQKQKQQSQKLQKQRQRLLQLAPARDHWRVRTLWPKSQCRDDPTLPRTVVEIQRHHDAGDRQQDGQELQDREVEKSHQLGVFQMRQRASVILLQTDRPGADQCSVKRFGQLDISSQMDVAPLAATRDEF